MENSINYNQLFDEMVSIRNQSIKFFSRLISFSTPGVPQEPQTVPRGAHHADRLASGAGVGVDRQPGWPCAAVVLGHCGGVRAQYRLLLLR